MRSLQGPGLWRQTGTAVYSNTGSRAPRFRNSSRKEHMPTTSVDLAQLSVNTIKFLSADAVEKAKSGHPGAPMGAADMAYVLWSKYLHFDSRDPKWPNRDRFVLSAGHASMLLYSLLHLFGFDLPREEILNFRQWGSRTPGHPEYGHTPGVEATTGPLGQGFANGVGMALAQRMMQARLERHADLLNHRVFGIVSDGDLMEGVSSEAASLAGHWNLRDLVYLYHDNRLSIEGSTRLAFRRDDPESASLWAPSLTRRVPENLDELLAKAAPGQESATRGHWGAVIQAAAQAIPSLVGGSGDLEPSPYTKIKDGGDVVPAG